MTIPLPKNTTDEIGHTYGRLKVLEYAGRTEPEGARRGGKAIWLCRCECGARVAVSGSKLRAGKVVSCGCWRADPGVRQAARNQTPAKRRKQIAQMGAAARWK